MDAHYDATAFSMAMEQLPPQLEGNPVPKVQTIEGPMAVLDKYGIVSFSTPAMGQMFKCSQRELEGRDVASLIPGLPLKTLTPGYNLAFADFWGNKGELLKFKGHSPNGERIPLAVSLNKLSIDNTPLILLRLLPGSEQTIPNGEFERLIESAKNKTDVVMITDTTGIIQAVNDAFEQATGYSKAEVVGQPASLMKSGLHTPEFYSKMWHTLLAGHEFQAVFVNRRKNGEIFHEDKNIRPFIDKSGQITHFVSTSHCLSESLRTTLLRLHHEAYHDALTGLPNRHLFEDRLKQAFSRASRRGENFSLVYLDLDSFKEINDTYGHAVGDEVLRTTATQLKACVRDEDTVARLGGDEFALILLDIHRREDIENVLKKILQSLERGIHLGNKRIPILASLGANIFPEDGTDSESLMMRADFAMYKAKAEGGHGFHFFNKEEFEGSAAKKRLAELLTAGKRLNSAYCAGEQATRH